MRYAGGSRLFSSVTGISNLFIVTNIDDSRRYSGFDLIHTLLLFCHVGLEMGENGLLGEII